MAIAGPELAAQALAAGLVDEFHVIVAPVVGGGTRFFPLGVRLDSRLVEERSFDDGFVALRYARTKRHHSDVERGSLDAS